METNKVVTLTFWVEDASKADIVAQIREFTHNLGANVMKQAIEDAPWQKALSEKGMRAIQESVYGVVSSLASTRKVLILKSLREAGVEKVRDLSAKGKTRAMDLPEVGPRIVEGLASNLKYRCPEVAWYDRPQAPQIARLYENAEDVPLFAVEPIGWLGPKITIGEFLKDPDHASSFHGVQLAKDVETFIRQFNIARKGLRK